MFNWLKNLRKEQMDSIVQEVEIPAVVIAQGEHSKPKKPKKPRQPKAKKETKAEPKVDILKFDFDPNDPRIGSIELDWNKEFIELLQSHGYAAATDEEIVDLWLNDVCKTIIANQFPGISTRAQSLAGNKVVSRKDLGEGKTEIS